MQGQGAVDIVYLWVDGSDPAWRVKRQAAFDRLTPEQQGEIAVFGNVEGRYRDSGELRYNLRALDRFFPEHGRVFLVTDRQIPSWLNADSGVQVVDHRDLIPHASLPVFDSGHIESYLHHIDGLSERYVYLNDDVFFGRSTTVDDLFFDYGVHVAWSDEPVVTDVPMQRESTALENACRSSAGWFRKVRQDVVHPAAAAALGYEHVFRTFAHSPRAMTKSIAHEAERMAPELFALARSTVFRQWDRPTVVSDFIMRWAMATGQARVVDWKGRYVASGDGLSGDELDLLQKDFGELDFFCVNDTTDNAAATDPRLLKVQRTLEHLLPVPSRYELVTELVD